MSVKTYAQIGLLILSLCPWSNSFANEPDGAKTLTIAADVWCPVNCDPQANNPGIGVDLARAVFESQGYTVSYIVMPWTRALQDVREGKIAAVIGANAEDEPSLVFPKVPIVNITDDFYVLTDSSVNYEGVESLRGLRLGIISDYGYDPKIQKLIDEQGAQPGIIQTVAGDTALEQNIKKLLTGRIDVVVESAIVMDYFLREMKLAKKIRHLGGIPQGYVYLAFSPALPQSHEIAALFDQGMMELEKTGQLHKIYQKYALTK